MAMGYVVDDKEMSEMTGGLRAAADQYGRTYGWIRMVEADARNRLIHDDQDGEHFARRKHLP